MWDDINANVGKIILLIFNYYFLCALKPGFNFKSHGSLSRIFFVMLLLWILIFKGSIAILGYIGKRSKLIKYSLISLFIAIISIKLIHKIYFTKDKFFLGFNGHKLEHGPHLMKLKALEKMINKKLPKEVYEKNKHLTGVCRFKKIGVNWYEAFDEFFWRFSH